MCPGGISWWVESFLANALIEWVQSIPKIHALSKLLKPLDFHIGSTVG